MLTNIERKGEIALPRRRVARTEFRLWKRQRPYAGHPGEFVIPGRPWLRRRDVRITIFAAMLVGIAIGAGLAGYLTGGA